MSAISALSLSRIWRMLWTQSKGFEARSLITWDLPRSSDLKKRISFLHVDGVVRVDSLQVDDVLEVPADQDVDSSHGGEGYVQGIRAQVCADSTVFDVGGREFLRLGGQGQGLD